MSSQTRQDLNLIKQHFIDKGYFDASLWWVYGRVFAVLVLFVLGAFVREWSQFLAICLASIGGITLVWWIHDAGHDAYFGSKRAAKIWIETLGIFFLGMPQIEYHFQVHRRHHGFTNIIGKDGALETGPIIWDARQFTAKRKNPWKLQAWVWFFFVLPLTWPLINFRCVQTLVVRRAVFRLFAVVLRWTVVPYLFGFDWVFIFCPILITGFVLGFAASLNHFHMKMDIVSLAPFPQNVFLTTQNLSNRSHFMTWLTGGLNFHVEHHLFPSMPSYNLHKVAPWVEEFARRHRLPYQVCSEREAIRKLVGRLREPNGLSCSKPTL